MLPKRHRRAKRGIFKIDDAFAEKVRALSNGRPQYEIGRLLGVSPATIGKVQRRYGIPHCGRAEAKRRDRAIALGFAAE